MIDQRAAGVEMRSNTGALVVERMKPNLAKRVVVYVESKRLEKESAAVDGFQVGSGSLARPARY